MHSDDNNRQATKEELETIITELENYKEQVLQNPEVPEEVKQALKEQTSSTEEKDSDPLSLNSRISTPS